MGDNKSSVVTPRDFWMATGSRTEVGRVGADRLWMGVIPSSSALEGFRPPRTGFLGAATTIGTEAETGSEPTKSNGSLEMTGAVAASGDCFFPMLLCVGMCGKNVVVVSTCCVVPEYLESDWCTRGGNLSYSKYKWYDVTAATNNEVNDKQGLTDRERDPVDEHNSTDTTKREVC